MKTSLGRICTFLNGGTPSRTNPSYFKGKIPWITGADITGPVVGTARSFITDEAVRESATTCVPAGTILLVTRTSVGKVAIAERDLCFSQDITAIRPDPAEVNTEFLVQFLRTKQGHLARQARGATIKGVSREVLASIEINLPPLDQQKRIAEVLEAADWARGKRRDSIARLGTLVPALLVHTFGDPISNPRGWPKRPLGDVIVGSPNNGLFRKNSSYDAGSAEGVPVVWVEDLFRGDSIDAATSRRLIPTAEEVEKYGLRNGDLLFCRSSLKLDGIAFNSVFLGEDDSALFECHVIRMSPDSSVVSPIFLNVLLRLPQMRAVAKSKAKTATMTTIDQRRLCSIEVPVPPIELQERFEKRVVATGSGRLAYERSRATLDALFASLQHRAFTGTLWPLASRLLPAHSSKQPHLPPY